MIEPVPLGLSSARPAYVVSPGGHARLISAVGDHGPQGLGLFLSKHQPTSASFQVSLLPKPLISRGE